MRPGLPESCQKALTWPEKPEHLSETDWLGIRVLLARLRFAGRFLAGHQLGGRHAREAEEAEKAGGYAATFWVLTQVRTPNQLNVLVKLDAEFRALSNWARDVYGPSFQRFSTRRIKCLTHEALVDSEPARTLSRLVIEEGIVDVDADRKAMGHAIAMSLHGTLDVRGFQPVTLAELDESYAFVTGRVSCVSRFDSDGRLALAERSIKTALDTAAGKYREPDPRPDDQAALKGSEDQGARAALEAVEVQEIQEALDAVLESLRCEVDLTRTQALALEFAETLLLANRSVADLAREHGINEVSLRSAWSVVRGRIAARFSARYPGLEADFGHPAA